MDKLPDDVIELISSFIRFVDDQKSTRLINKLFHSFISHFTIKVSSLNQRFGKILFERLYQYKSMRKHCVNAECIHSKVCTGTVFLFQYYPKIYNEIKWDLEFPETHYLWLHHDSRTKSNFITKQQKLFIKLDEKRIKKEGDFSKIYMPYCNKCSAKFIIEKLPPHYR